MGKELNAERSKAWESSSLGGAFTSRFHSHLTQHMNEHTDRGRASCNLWGDPAWPHVAQGGLLCVDGVDQTSKVVKASILSDFSAMDRE